MKKLLVLVLIMALSLTMVIGCSAPAEEEAPAEEVKEEVAAPEEEEAPAEDEAPLLAFICKGMYVAQHSCGDIVDIFPDLIEIGMDIYNTFQPEIYDIRYVKKEFGNDITFYGGISTQNVMPFGSQEDVKAQVRELLEVMNVNGGYICAPTHSIPNDVPTENILAFMEEVQNQQK